MLEQKLLQAIERVKSRKPYLRYTELYPSVSEEYLELVQNDFPEYDKSKEIPLLFFNHADTAKYERTWICLTDQRLYYKIPFFPPILIAMDCIPLRKIQSFRMRSLWLSHTLYINGQKTGNIILLHQEMKFIKKYIRAVLDNVDSSDTDTIEDQPYVINYYPEAEWQQLENAWLFPLVHEYFSEHNQAGRRWGFAHFYTNPFIRPEGMEQARKVYADYDPEEEIPLLFVENGTTTTFVKTDEDLTGGIVITNKYIYYKLIPNTGYKDAKANKIALSSLQSFKIKFRFFSWVYINNKKGITTAFGLIPSRKRAARVFEKLMNIIVFQLCSRGRI
jgi:hypothetical protein